MDIKWPQEMVPLVNYDKKTEEDYITEFLKKPFFDRTEIPRL